MFFVCINTAVSSKRLETRLLLWLFLADDLTHLRRGSLKELPPPLDWTLDMSLGAFSQLLIDGWVPSLLWAGEFRGPPSRSRKQARKQLSSMLSASVLAWAPVLAFLHDGLRCESVSQIKFPSPEVFLVSILSQQEKTNQDKGLEDSSSVQITSTGAGNNFSAKSISKSFGISFPHTLHFFPNIFPIKVNLNTLARKTRN